MDQFAREGRPGQTRGYEQGLQIFLCMYVCDVMNKHCQEYDDLFGNHSI